VVYLLHGLTAKNQDWGAIPDILAKAGFHVFAFDMRGHGQSDKPEEGYAPEDHARDVEVCAQTLGHSRVHVVGHSTGGRNALVFAGLYPERAWSLTIVDQTLTADPLSYQKYLARYQEYPTPFADEKSLDKFLQKKFKKDQQRYFYYKGQFSRNDKGQWDWNFSPQAAWKTQKLGREKEGYDLLAKVQCPMLFIKGGDSYYVTPEEAEKISRFMPNGQLVVVPNAEHAVFRDNPEEFLRVLVPFLLKQSQGKLFVVEEGKA
jgi:esterase